MNILLLSWRGPGHPNAGGAEISTHEHAKGWIKAGHSVILFTSYYRGAKREEVIDGVTVIRRGSQFFGVHKEAFKWYLWKDHLKFDLVIDQFHGIPFFTPLYVKTKKIAFIHEVAKKVWKLNQFIFPLNVLVYILGITFEQFIFLLYQKISFLTVSESTKKDLIEWGIPGNNITVIHNGISKISINLQSKEKKNTIVYLGALAKDKGIEKALQVFSLLNSSGGNWQFWIIGKSDQQYLKELKNKGNKLGIVDSIKFWGYVDERKKYEFLSRAHLLINPSIHEGWGLVVIEAAAVGTPTVAFNVAGLRDSILNGKTGVLCKLSPQVMAQEINKLMEDKKEYDKLSNNAVVWSRNFTWEKATKESLNLIKEVVNY